MPDTTTRGFPYPLGSDKGFTLDDTVQGLAERVDGEYVSAATQAALPAASSATAGRVGYVTGTGDYWRDTGSAWRWERSAAVWHCGAGAGISLTAGTPAVLPLPGGGSAFEIAGRNIFEVASFGGVIAVGPTVAGQYEITARATFDSAGFDGNTYLRIVSYVPPSTTETTLEHRAYLSATAQPHTVRATVSLAAGERIGILARSPFAVSAQLRGLRIERVSP